MKFNYAGQPVCIVCAQCALLVPSRPCTGLTHLAEEQHSGGLDPCQRQSAGSTDWVARLAAAVANMDHELSGALAQPGHHIGCIRSTCRRRSAQYFPKCTLEAALCESHSMHTAPDQLFAQQPWQCMQAGEHPGSLDRKGQQLQLQQAALHRMTPDSHAWPRATAGAG